MAERQRTPTQAEANRIEITRRYLRGETQVAIATALGMTQPMVSYDLRVMEDRWRASGLLDIEVAKGKELARVDHLELTYWQAWEASREDRQIATQKQRGADAPNKEIMLRKEGQAGNPAFLSGVQWCIDRRCKLLGLDAPVKLDHRISMEQAARLTEEELDAELERRGVL